MRKKNQLRFGLVALALIIAGLLVVPTVAPERPDWLRSFTPERGAKLGLDLQGGMHLVLGVDTDAALTSRLRYFRGRVDKWAGEQQVVTEFREAGATQVQVALPADKLDAFKAWLEDFGGTFEISASAIEGQRADLTVAIVNDEIKMIRDWAVLQSLETIRNRIDQYGVAEPSIQRQGDDQIVVQLPGIEDTERAINLIGKTAQLTFHMVRNDVSVPDLDKLVDDLLAANPEFKRDAAALNAALAATLPTGVAIRFQRIADEFGSASVPVLVSAEPEMSGETVVDARVRIEQQFNQPYVMLEFNAEGSQLFAELTANNVGKQLAIVLDESVYSAPVIREKIAGGVASIEGGFTIDEARDLAIVLRAGALPADVSIQEERTVGPSLGQDSIRRGVQAISVGSFLVFIFMLIYYKLGGLIANVALAANLLLLLALMGLFQATLTLPGLAGIALTIGMAVDGNILIYERIREELRQGKSVRVAVELGFSKALWSILDANITTLIAGVILFQFGTGPVRGFAVTLSAGILTTLFTVLVLTRTLLDMYVQRPGVNKLPI